MACSWPSRRKSGAAGLLLLLLIALSNGLTALESPNKVANASQTDKVQQPIDLVMQMKQRYISIWKECIELEG
jgi:hypothetical protein